MYQNFIVSIAILLHIRENADYPNYKTFIYVLSLICRCY